MSLRLLLSVWLAAQMPRRHRSASAWAFSSQLRTTVPCRHPTCVSAKSSKPKTRQSSGSSALKGFGSPALTTKSVPVDKGPTTRAFYEYLDAQGAGDNLKRTSLAFLPVGENVSLRGVVALRDIKKGEDIINIPYELAIDLGPQGGDPTIPAVQLLRDVCESHHSQRDPVKYYRMLPEFQKGDCLGSTDFFSDAALEALQSPLIQEETLQRRLLTKLRFQKDIASDESFPRWMDGSVVTQEHLAWAVWIITSRVLTVQGDATAGDQSSHRLLIPYLDMCNHERSSVHVLTGRACANGQLRIVAGAPIKAGTQVTIAYGVDGNDRFIQDYGFLDTSTSEGFRLVAQQLLGKARVRDGPTRSRMLPETDRERTLERLRETTMAQDQDLLRIETDPQLQMAIEYRWRLKQALSELMEVS